MPSITRRCVSIILGLWTTAANPQDFCQTVASVVAQAGNNFRQFRGPRDEWGDYVSKFMLPGAASCYIDGAYSAFVCIWRGVSDSSRAKADLARGIEECYPQAKTSTQDTNRGTSYSIRTSDITFRIHGDRGNVFLGTRTR